MVTNHNTTYHSSNNQPIIHTPRPLQMKPRPQPRAHNHTRHHTHGNNACGRAPVPGLGIHVVGRRPGVMRAVAGREQRGHRVWSHYLYIPPGRFGRRARARFLEKKKSRRDRRALHPGSADGKNGAGEGSGGWGGKEVELEGR
jgi:hypothetical protein